MSHTHWHFRTEACFFAFFFRHKCNSTHDTRRTSAAGKRGGSPRTLTTCSTSWPFISNSINVASLVFGSTLHWLRRSSLCPCNAWYRNRGRKKKENPPAAGDRRLVWTAYCSVDATICSCIRLAMRMFGITIMWWTSWRSLFLPSPDLLLALT